MKKVRFETPNKALQFTMDDTECHSPRPFIEKKLNAPIPDLPYEYENILLFNNDSKQMYECSNSSPYPSANKTNLSNSKSSTSWYPTNELELSMLDATCHEPKQRVFSKSILKPLENKEYMTFSNVQDQSSIEHTKLSNVQSNDNGFFIRRDNIDKYHVHDLKPLHKCFNELNLDKENNPLAKKVEMLKMGVSNTTPVSVEEINNVPSPSLNPSTIYLNNSCRCHHCIKITPNIAPYPECNGYINCFSRTNEPVRVSQNQCDCVVIPKACSIAAQNQQMQVHATCHYKCVACNTPQNTVDKKTWAIEKYEENNKKECTDIKKQTNVNEKREPTVADLFKIIKLQNEQLQLLQEKVDKFIASSKSGMPNIQSYPVQNFMSEHVALETVDTGQHKISIGVMTSFEMVRTSTVINKEILTQTNENAQVQCNRSHVSIKEVVKSQPNNLNFLEGIMPIVQSDGRNVHEYMPDVGKNVEDDRAQLENANDEKTLNELSLYNVQVDNAITPLMSPEQSLYLDVRDYSDSDSSSDDQSHVGWTYYNKVMTHVNGMLQDSDMPSSASGLYRNTRQQCIQMQIDKTNVSVTKRVKFGDDPLGIHQPHIYTASTDTSLKMNQLAAKYLKNVPNPVQYQQPVLRHTTMPVDMSFATRNYMERHKLLQDAPSARPLPPNEMPRFLDITALKQQPKLL